LVQCEKTDLVCGGCQFFRCKIWRCWWDNEGQQCCR